MNSDNQNSSMAVPITEISMGKLMEMDLPVPQFVVENLIHPGTTELAAAPKSGKSWMALQLGICVSEGKPFLGYATRKGDVLYLALEDTMPGIQSRFDKVLPGMGNPNNDRLFIRTEAPRLGEGFEQEIDGFIAKHPETILTIVDVYRKIRSLNSTKMNSSNAYNLDGGDADILNAIAKKHGIAIIIINHTRKKWDPNDPFANSLGSTGTGATVDNRIVFHRNGKGNPNDFTASLYCEGRYIPQNSLQIEFVKDAFIWEDRGSTAEIERRRLIEEYHNDPVVKCIIERMRESPKGFDSKAESFSEYVKEHTGMEIAPNATGRRIRKWADLLLSENNIRCVPPTSTKDKIYRFELVCENNNR